MRIRAALALLLILASTAFAAKRRVGVPRKPLPAKLYRGDAQRSGVSSGGAPLTLQRMRWSRDLTGPVRGVVFHDGVVYVGASGGMYAFDPATGEELWSFLEPGRTFTPPAIAGDLVYTCAGPRFYAIDRRSHAIAWSFTADSSVGSTPPLIAGDAAYIGSDNGTVYAIDLVARAERWHAASGGGVRTYLTASNDLVFATHNGGVLRAFDMADGRVIWTKTLAGGNDWTEIAAGGELVFAGASGNDLYAIDARTGVVRWTFNDTNSDRSGWCGPVVANGVVYAGNQNRRMFAFDAATGRVLWRLDTEDAATTDPTLAGDILYFGVGSHGASNDEAPRDIYAVAASTGTVISRFRAIGLVLGGCDVGDGAVFIHTLARKLIAIE